MGSYRSVRTCATKYNTSTYVRESIRYMVSIEIDSRATYTHSDLRRNKDKSVIHIWSESNFVEHPGHCHPYVDSIYYRHNSGSLKSTSKWVKGLSGSFLRLLIFWCLLLFEGWRKLMRPSETDEDAEEKKELDRKLQRSSSEYISTYPCTSTRTCPFLSFKYHCCYHVANKNWGGDKACENFRQMAARRKVDS